MAIGDSCRHDQIGEICANQRPRLLAFARKLTHDRAAAEDAVQQAAVRVLSSSRTPDGDMTAYLCASVRNAIVDEHRAKVRRERRRNVSPAEPFCPYCEMARIDDCRAVRRAVDSLPPRYREVVMLHLWTELSFREIAEALDKPLFTISSRYRRALARLRVLLSEETGGNSAQFRAR